MDYLPTCLQKIENSNGIALRIILMPGIDLGWLCARQAPYLLYYCSSSSFGTLNNEFRREYIHSWKIYQISWLRETGTTVMNKKKETRFRRIRNWVEISEKMKPHRYVKLLSHNHWPVQGRFVETAVKVFWISLRQNNLPDHGTATLKFSSCCWHKGSLPFYLC